MAAFTLNGVTVKIAATITTGSTTINMSGKETVRTVVVGTGQVFVASGLGSAVATLNSTPLVTSSEAFSIPANHDTVAAITATGTADVYFTVGVGV